jgi:hypothetical protein
VKKRHFKMVFNIVTIAASLVAAILWWYGSNVTVPPVPGQSSIILDGADLRLTLAASAYWNKLAAIAAAGAALGQAMASYFDVTDAGDY